MNKTKFLVTLLAAALTALVLVWLQRGPKENTPSHTPPAVSQSLPDTSGIALVKAGVCAPTECKFAAVISPAFALASNGKPVVGIWNIARSSQSVINLRNVSPDVVSLSAITLYTCLNEAVVPVSSVPAQCQYIKISQSDYKGGNMDLKPGDSISTTIDSDTHGQVAKLQFDTTRGPIILIVTVQ